jgi:hypothetical protein
MNEMETFVNNIKKNPKLFLIISSSLTAIVVINELFSYFERVRNNLIIGILTIVTIYLLIMFGIKNRIWED